MGSESIVISATQTGPEYTVTFKVPSTGYLDNLMRANCFPELHALFTLAHGPAKELTESYSALQKLRKTIDKPDSFWRVIHVGDGAHARTAAMFSFMTSNTENISVDPACNEEVLTAWRDKFGVKRFSWIKAKIEECVWDERPTLVTFVHAHVNVDSTLEKIPGWVAAYSSACCYPQKQKTKIHKVLDEGADWRILSPERNYQVIANG